MRILIVEDCDFMAKAIKAALESNGHQVTWVVGFQSVQPLVAIRSNMQPQPLNARNFDVAFVDGQLEGKLEGPAVVLELTSKHVKCVGISSTVELNAAMLTSGATLAIQKVTSLAAVASDLLTPELVAHPTEGLQLELTALTDRIRQDKEMRGRLDELVKPFMQ